jgi:hypothetical protein
MPATVVSVCNVALSRSGVNRSINDIDEASQEAVTCKLHYENVRDEVLRDVAWPFATRYADLALVASVPNGDWQYAYRAPSDMIRPIRIVTGVRAEHPRTVFKRGSDASGGLIYADQPEATLEYTGRIEDPTMFSPDFASALAWRLAMEIGPALSNAPAWGDRAARYYAAAIAASTTNAANEQAGDQFAEAEWIEARG